MRGLVEGIQYRILLIKDANDIFNLGKDNS